MGEAIVGVIGTLLGTILGWVLGRLDFGKMSVSLLQMGITIGGHSMDIESANAENLTA